MASLIGIGRRKGAGPLLSDNRWRWFKASVRGILRGLDATIIAECEGAGGWEGVAEPCACFVFDLPDDTSLSVLRSMLAVLAGKYGQDAIALTIGKTEFIGASHA